MKKITIKKKIFYSQQKNFIQLKNSTGNLFFYITFFFQKMNRECDFQILLSLITKGNSANANSTLNEIVNQINPKIKQIKCQKSSKCCCGTPRILFKKEEDERIIELVKIFGTRHWPLVAQFLEGRTAKQCRDRYSNYLIPGFFQGEWTDNEDALLLKLYKEIGPRWSLIKKSFPNRSANNIKNRWYYFLHKKVQFPDNQIALKNEKEFQKVEQKKKIETEMIVDPLKKVDGEMIKDTAKLVENLFDDSINEFEDPFFQNEDCDIFIENEISNSFFNNNIEVENDF